MTQTVDKHDIDGRLFTARQLRILRALGQDPELSNHELAQEIHYSDKTVKNELFSIYNDVLQLSDKDPRDDPLRYKKRMLAAKWARDHEDAIDTALSGGDMGSTPPEKSLPVYLDPLFGREKDIENVCAKILDSQVHLLTIVSAHGAGKSRVAVEVARAVADAFADGVLFVDLSALTRPEEIMTAVAAAARLRDASPAATAGALRDKDVLLLVDNFEHLVEGGAEVLAGLLQKCPGLKALCTSRAPLDAAGETRYPLPALPIDDAVALFLERAVLDSLGEAGDVDVAAAKDICIALDCLPLCIELTAPLLRIYSMAELAESLRSGTYASRGSKQNLPRYQETLQSSIERTTSQLTLEQRRMLMHLSVLRGSWPRPVAEAMLGRAKPPFEAPLTDLEALVRWNLLQRQEVGVHVRFSMYWTVRAFAAEELASGNFAYDACKAHAESWLEFAENLGFTDEFGPGPESGTPYEQLDPEYGNLSSALDWALNRDELVLAGQLFKALESYWYARYKASDFREVFDQIVTGLSDLPAADRERLPHGLEARLLDARAFLAMAEDDYPKVEECVSKILSTYYTEVPSVVTALLYLGGSFLYQGKPQEATNLLQPAYDLAQRASDRRLMARAASYLGWAYMETGDEAAAGRLFEEKLALCNELDMDIGRAIALADLAEWNLFVGNLAAASSFAREAREASEELNHRMALMRADTTEGAVMVGLRDPSATESAFRRAIERDTIDSPVLVADALRGLACAAMMRGDAKRAAREFGAAQGIFERAGASACCVYVRVENPYEEEVRGSPDPSVAAAWTEGYTAGLAAAGQTALLKLLARLDRRPPPEVPF